MSDRKVIGYTTGVFDLFHVGHLNILKEAQKNCDYLIVGVTTDEEVKRTKGIEPFIPFEERLEIVQNIKVVDEVVAQESMDKMAAWEKLRFDVMFVGSDWKGTPEWNEYEKQFAKVGVDIVYFPYTAGTSSTKIRKIINKKL